MQLSKEIAYRQLSGGGPGSGRYPKGSGGAKLRKLLKPRKPQQEAVRQLDPEAAKSLDHYLEMTSKFGAGRSSFLKEHGQAYTESAPAPKMGKMKECYTNAFHAALDNPNLTYVEGMAVPGSIGFPMEHAWTVDKQGRVVDPTWPDGQAYFGIPFQHDYVRKVALRSGVYGILSYTNPDLFEGMDKNWKASAQTALKR